MPWYGPEFKPTDEQTRFFIVPSTGAAMLLVSQIGRPNMGLTIAEAPVLVVPRELHFESQLAWGTRPVLPFHGIRVAFSAALVWPQCLIHITSCFLWMVAPWQAGGGGSINLSKSGGRVGCCDSTPQLPGADGISKEISFAGTKTQSPPRGCVPDMKHPIAEATPPRLVNSRLV